MAQIYEKHGIELAPASRDAMAAYVATNRKGKFGLHRYDIRELGIAVEEERERVAFYYEAYDILFEQPGESM